MERVIFRRLPLNRLRLYDKLTKEAWPGPPSLRVPAGWFVGWPPTSRRGGGIRISWHPPDGVDSKPIDTEWAPTFVVDVSRAEGPVARSLNDSEQMTIWVGALRYYMGRRSYAVGLFGDALRAHWAGLPADVREIIRRDVECEIRRDDRARADGSTYRPLGHDCDRKQWESVRELWAGAPEGGGEIE